MGFLAQYIHYKWEPKFAGSEQQCRFGASGVPGDENGWSAVTWETRKPPEENQAHLTSFLICSKTEKLISGVKFWLVRRTLTLPRQTTACTTDLIKQSRDKYCIVC